MAAGNALAVLFNDQALGYSVFALQRHLQAQRIGCILGEDSFTVRLGRNTPVFQIRPTKPEDASHCSVKSFSIQEHKL